MHEKQNPAAVIAIALCFLCLMTLDGAATAGDNQPQQPSDVRRLRIAVSGNLAGNILPTWSCVGQELGGLPRRFTFIKTLRQETSGAGNTVPLMLLDTGGIFGGESEFPEHYAEYYMTALKYMGCDAMNLGPAEFQKGKTVISHMAAAADFPLISSNAPEGDPAWKAFTIKTFNGIRVGILGVVSPDLVSAKEGEPVLTPPRDVLSGLVKKVRKQADIVVLLAQMDDTDIVDLLNAVPGIDIAVAEELNSMQGNRTGNTLLVGFEMKGMSVSVIELFWNVKNRKMERFSVISVLMDNTLEDDPALIDMTRSLNEKIDQGREEARAREMEAVVSHDQRDAEKIREIVKRAQGMTPEEFLNNMDILLKSAQEEEGSVKNAP